MSTIPDPQFDTQDPIPEDEEALAIDLEKDTGEELTPLGVGKVWTEGHTLILQGACVAPVRPSYQADGQPTPKYVELIEARLLVYVVHNMDPKWLGATPAALTYLKKIKPGSAEPKKEQASLTKNLNDIYDQRKAQGLKGRMPDDLLLETIRFALLEAPLAETEKLMGNVKP